MAHFPFLDDSSSCSSSSSFWSSFSNGSPGLSLLAYPTVDEMLGPVQSASPCSRMSRFGQAAVGVGKEEDWPSALSTMTQVAPTPMSTAYDPSIPSVTPTALTPTWYTPEELTCPVPGIGWHPACIGRPGEVLGSKVYGWKRQDIQPEKEFGKERVNCDYSFADARRSSTKDAPVQMASYSRMFAETGSGRGCASFESGDSSPLVRSSNILGDLQGSFHVPFPSASLVVSSPSSRRTTSSPSVLLSSVSNLPRSLAPLISRQGSRGRDPLTKVITASSMTMGPTDSMRSGLHTQRPSFGSAMPLFSHLAPASHQPCRLPVPSGSLPWGTAQRFEEEDVVLQGRNEMERVKLSLPVVRCRMAVTIEPAETRLNSVTTFKSPSSSPFSCSANPTSPADSSSVFSFDFAASSSAELATTSVTNVYAVAPRTHALSRRSVRNPGASCVAATRTALWSPPVNFEKYAADIFGPARRRRTHESHFQVPPLSRELVSATLPPARPRPRPTRTALSPDFTPIEFNPGLSRRVCGRTAQDGVPRSTFKGGQGTGAAGRSGPGSNAASWPSVVSSESFPAEAAANYMSIQQPQRGLNASLWNSSGATAIKGSSSSTGGRGEPVSPVIQNTTVTASAAAKQGNSNPVSPTTRSGLSGMQPSTVLAVTTGSIAVGDDTRFGIDSRSCGSRGVSTLAFESSLNALSSSMLSSDMSSRHTLLGIFGSKQEESSFSTPSNDAAKPDPYQLITELENKTKFTAKRIISRGQRVALATPTSPCQDDVIGHRILSPDDRRPGQLAVACLPTTALCCNAWFDYGFNLTMRPDRAARCRSCFKESCDAMAMGLGRRVLQPAKTSSRSSSWDFPSLLSDPSSFGDPSERRFRRRRLKASRRPLSNAFSCFPQSTKHTKSTLPARRAQARQSLRDGYYRPRGYLARVGVRVAFGCQGEHSRAMAPSASCSHSGTAKAVSETTPTRLPTCPAQKRQNPEPSKESESIDSKLSAFIAKVQRKPPPLSRTCSEAYAE